MCVLVYSMQTLGGKYILPSHITPPAVMQLGGIYSSSHSLRVLGGSDLLQNSVYEYGPAIFS